MTPCAEHKRFDDTHFQKWSNSAEVLKVLVAHHQVGFMKCGHIEVKSSMRTDGVQLTIFVTL